MSREKTQDFLETFIHYRHFDRDVDKINVETLFPPVNDVYDTSHKSRTGEILKSLIFRRRSSLQFS